MTDKTKGLETGIFAAQERARERSAAESCFMNDTIGVFTHNKIQRLVDDDHEKGIARIGGPYRTPRYREAYVLAAQRLAEVAKQKREFDELGVPIMYCLRHSIELALKDLIDLAHEVRNEAACLPDKDIEAPDDNEKKKLLDHSLSRLRAVLIAELEKIELGPQDIDEELYRVVTKLDNIESGMDGELGPGERFRYQFGFDTETQRFGTDHGLPKETEIKILTRKSSFREAEPLEVEELCRRVAKAIESTFAYSKDEFETSNKLEAKLYREQRWHEWRFIRDYEEPWSNDVDEPEDVVSELEKIERQVTDAEGSAPDWSERNIRTIARARKLLQMQIEHGK